MLEHYTNESAAALLLEVTGIQEMPENCSGLAACLNATIAKIQTSYTPVDKRNDDTFEHKTKCNDWRNHVPTWIIDVWKHLSGTERALVALVADHAASAEDWD